MAVPASASAIVYAKQDKLKEKALRIGAGAGYSGDRIDPAVDLAERGQLDYLIFECLAERTIADAQLRRQADPDQGFDPFLEDRLSATLRACCQNGTRIISNMGAANAAAAAQCVRKIAVSLGYPELKIATVSGDDVLATCRAQNIYLDNGQKINDLGDAVISANAYIGAGPIAGALAAGADVVMTGRVSDPALFLGPLIHEFGWRMDDWDILGKGTLIGHLLECAGQICGGYFADPGFKDVPDMARLGFPFADVSADGSAEISKLDGTGGRIDAATVKEQILYEIHNPARYFQPDVIADFSQVRVHETGANRVRVTGAGGAARTGKLKVSVSYRNGYIGEGQISYAGPNAIARGQLAIEILRERLSDIKDLSEMRFDLIGLNALHGAAFMNEAIPYEVRVRLAGRSADPKIAARIGHEVEALYTNGPAGGGGAYKNVKPGIALASALLDESCASPAFAMLEDSF